MIALSLAACAAKLPQAKVDAAVTAYADAKTALADQYAPESWKAADDANLALQTNLEAKEYGKTAALAKTLLEASGKAKADAAAGLEAVKAECTALIADSGALLPAVKAELALAAKAGKKGAALVKTAKPVVEGADKALAEAQASLDAGSAIEAKTALTALKAGLADAQAALEAAGFKN
jgi:hypothetical protein